MASITLTDARIKALTPRRSARDIRDAKLKGFGVRVLPSGRKSYFVHCQHEGQRVWKTVGDAGDIGAGEARSRAAALLAEIRQDGPVPASPDDTIFEAVAGAAFLQARAALEAPHAEGEPRLSPQSDPAAVRRSPDRGDHPA